MDMELFEKNVKSFLQQDITPDELNALFERMEYKKIPKNGYVFKEGDSPTHVAFVIKGILTFFYVTDEKKHIKKIYFKNEWASDYGAFLRRTPYQSYLQALEPSEVLLLSYEAMQNGYKKAKVFERFGRLIAERLYLEQEEKARLLMSTTPEERYNLLIEKNPEIITKIPLKYIASMLGIQPESLSRIRRRSAGKK